MTMKTIIAAVVIIAACAGCNLFNQHAQMMDTMRGAITESSRRLGDSSVGQYAAGAQVIDPGIVIEAGLKYFASARYAGVAGQITASAQGQLDRQLPPEVIAELGIIYRNTSWSSEQKLNAVRELLAKWVTDQAVKEDAVQPVE
jgi:hypothetical protein